MIADVLGDAQGIYADVEVRVVEQLVRMNVGEADADESVVKIGKPVEFLHLIVTRTCRVGGRVLYGDKVPVLHESEQKFVALVEIESGEGRWRIGPAASDLKNFALRVLVGEQR